jgi:phospholipid transport system substrate-binding protein
MVSVLLVTGASFALEGNTRAAESPQSAVVAMQERVDELLHQPTSPERDREVALVLEAMLDYDRLARASMGRHWGELSPSQRSEFLGLFKRVVQRSYEQNVAFILDWSVEPTGEEPADDGVIVHTLATSREHPEFEPLAMDYLLVESAGGLRIVDIITEGSSLVKTYRFQFNRTIEKDGYTELVRQMKRKIGWGT